MVPCVCCGMITTHQHHHPSQLSWSIGMFFGPTAASTALRAANKARRFFPKGEGGTPRRPTNDDAAGIADAAFAPRRGCPGLLYCYTSIHDETTSTKKNITSQRSQRSQPSQPSRKKHQARNNNPTKNGNVRFANIFILLTIRFLYFRP